MATYKNKWHPIPEYPNYKVSNEGNVLSLNYNGSGKSKILKFGDSRNYRNVTLYNYRHKKTFKIHRLVAEEFCINTKKYLEVNHIDGNKLNNNYKNLEWCTRKENANHAIRVLKIKSVKGQKHGQSKLRDKDVLYIYKEAKCGKPYSPIAKKFNISKATITNIKKGLVWSHLTGENKCQ